MNQGDQQSENNTSEGISMADLADKIKSAIRYFKSKWLTIVIISTLGALSGLYYSIVKRSTYTGICTFVLEDSKSGGGGLSQYAGLASLAGINLGESGGGIFQGDNIIELYKSRTMLEKTLLSSCNFEGKNQLLINRFLNIYDPPKGKNNNKPRLNFDGNPDNFNRNQDSVITGLVYYINKKLLNVIRPDKKLNIISVQFVTVDELLSKCFTEKLVQNVNDFYIQTKTKKTSENVRILQRQADSVRKILNSSITGVASANEAAPNANPDMATLRVTSQKRQVDVQANTVIYSQMVQNLELAKISLMQETPLIQIVDKPVLPLAKNNIGWPMGLSVGAILGLFFSIFLLTIRKVFKKNS